MSEQVDLKHMLDRANDALAADSLPAQGDMTALEKSYGKANNEAACPCGSGRKYEECCKQMWQVLDRGARNFKKESKKDRKTRKQAEKEQKRMEKTDRWFCKLGLDEKGRPIVDTTDMEGKEMDGFMLAGFILNAYHNLMIEGQILMLNGACNKLGAEVMKRVAGMSAGRSSVPMK